MTNDTNNTKKIFQASLLVALSGILYGFLGYLGTSIIQENMSISNMLFWRFIIAGIWMYLFVLRKQFTRHTFGIENRILFFMFLLGAVGYAGSSWFYFMASRDIGTGLSMVIFFSYPIIVALLSWVIYRKKLKLGTVITLAIMFIGLCLLRDSTGQVIGLTGIFFALLSSLSYACYVIGSQRFSSKMDSNVLTTVVCAGCAVLFLVLTFSAGEWMIPHTLRSWVYLLALGIFATALPIQLMLEGLKYISSMRASIISVLEPLVTVCLGVILLSESISFWQVIGGCLILGSALLVQFQRGL